MKQYITEFVSEHDYPEQAITTILSAYDDITKNKVAQALFDANRLQFNANVFQNGDAVLVLLDKVAEIIPAHKYTVYILFYICLSRDTKARYIEKNIPLNIFFDTMEDLKWKLFECDKMYGIWGSYVASWFKGFFDLTRFTLGRLQFEATTFEEDDITLNGHVIKKGDTLINMHIPSSGPLTPQVCLDSYKQAHKFYADLFPSGVTAFTCNSWLLFPDHDTFLPQNSNILKFMHDFTILKRMEYDHNGDLWRIFYKEFNGNLDELPRDTALQRAYIDWLSKGNPTGYAIGVFLFDGTNIL